MRSPAVSKGKEILRAAVQVEHLHHAHSHPPDVECGDWSRDEMVVVHFRRQVSVYGVRSDSRARHHIIMQSRVSNVAARMQVKLRSQARSQTPYSTSHVRPVLALSSLPLHSPRCSCHDVERGVTSGISQNCDSSTDRRAVDLHLPSNTEIS